MLSGGAVFKCPDAGFEAAAIALSPDYTDENMRNAWRAQEVSVDRLMPAVLESSMSSVKDLRIPVFLLLGKYDINVSS